jgi:8-oxo-dGTP diphosphatase
MDVGDLASISENIVEYKGEKLHQCTLIHWCDTCNAPIEESLIHQERPEIRLKWCSLNQLKQKPTYPEGIIDIILANDKRIRHLLTREV